MFSEAISSIWSCWRCSSSPIALNSSGSRSASGMLKNPGIGPDPVVAMVMWGFLSSIWAWASSGSVSGDLADALVLGIPVASGKGQGCGSAPGKLHGRQALRFNTGTAAGGGKGLGHGAIEASQALTVTELPYVAPSQQPTTSHGNCNKFSLGLPPRIWAGKKQ